MEDFKQSINKENDNHSIPSGSGNHPNRNGLSNEYGDKKASMVRFDQKTIILLLGAGFSIANGFIVHRFSEEFDAKFEKSIRHYEFRIQTLEEDTKYLKNQLFQIMIQVQNEL